MRRRTLFAAMTLLAAGVAMGDTRENREAREEEPAGEPQIRPIEPTPDELAAFQLTQPLDYTEGYDSNAFRLSGTAMFAASVADLATTELGLSQGLQEANPVARQRGIRIATHVAGPMAVYYATERLQRAGKTKLALALRISLMAAYSYAAIHNTRLMSSR